VLLALVGSRYGHLLTSLCRRGAVAGEPKVAASHPCRRAAALIRVGPPDDVGIEGAVRNRAGNRVPGDEFVVDPYPDVLVRDLDEGDVVGRENEGQEVRLRV